MSRLEIALALWAVLAAIGVFIMWSTLHLIERERDQVVRVVELEKKSEIASEVTMYEKIIEEQAESCSFMLAAQIKGCEGELNICRAALPGDL